MIHLEMTPTVSTIRVYDQPGGYEQRLPYIGIVMVTYITDKEVCLQGAHGKVDRATLDKVLALLQEKGVTMVRLERRGRMKTIKL